jgi:putative FmdB family regulatory protein
MPLYDYRCIQCGEQFEAQHPMNAARPACPNCDGPVRKLILGTPHCRIDWKGGFSHGSNRMVIRAARQGRASPIDAIADPGEWRKVAREHRSNQ